MINISSGKFRVQLGFLLAWVSTNILFLLIFLNLNKSRDEQSRLSKSADMFIYSADRSLKDLKKDFNQSTICIRKFIQTGEKTWLEKMKAVRADLGSYQPLFTLLLPADSAFHIQNTLKQSVDERILLIENITRVSKEQGLAAAAARLKKDALPDKGKQIAVLTDDLSSQYHGLILQTGRSLNNHIGMANRPFLILVVFFNVLFPLIYWLLRNTFRRLEDRDRFLEQEIEKKAAELNKVYDRINDSFIALDNEWRYTYINKNATDLHGLNPKDLIGKSIFDVFPGLVDQPFYHALHEAKSTQKSLRLELYYSVTDQWFEDLIYPNQDGISIYYHDITEKKKAMIALQESEASLKKSYEQFNLVSKATTDALWDWDMVENKIFGNLFFNELFRISNESTVSREIFMDHLHPDDAKRVAENFQNIVKTKATYWSDEFRFRKSDGTYRTMYNRAYVLFNADGYAYRMLGAMQDITNLQLARRQLMLEKELSDSIINSLPGIFYLFNRAGHLYLWNRNFEEVSGYYREEISRLHPLDFFSEDERQLLIEKISSVFQNGKDSVEAHFVTKNGTRIPYYFNGLLINYEGEDCLVGVGIDISEKVHAHNELRELATHLQHVRENERTSIAREIHDELGQQLTGLKMDVSWLGKKLAGIDEQASVKINDIIKLIDETVKTVRRISTQLRPSILDDLGLIAAMEWQSDEFEKRSEIPIDFISNVSTIQLPPDMTTGLFRIFQECLTNISRHSEASHIEARLHVRDRNLTLQIRDNGRGFDTGEIGQKKTLGLLGMKERTLLMGGTCEINSKPGEGTLVEITVPVPQSVMI